MGTIKEKTVSIYTLEDCKVVGVEAGNVNKLGVEVEDTVVAMTVKPNDLARKFKVILKGQQASSVYNLFLSNGNTIDKTLADGSIKIEKGVTVSFTASKREDRSYETVLENATNIEFKFNYKVVV